MVSEEGSIIFNIHEPIVTIAQRTLRLCDYSLFQHQEPYDAKEKPWL